MLKHIQDECAFLLSESKNLDLDRFLKNEILKRAFSRILEIIGEASKGIPIEFKKIHTDLDWKERQVYVMF